MNCSFKQHKRDKVIRLLSCLRSVSIRSSEAFPSRASVFSVWWLQTLKSRCERGVTFLRHKIKHSLTSFVRRSGHSASHVWLTVSAVRPIWGGMSCGIWRFSCSLPLMSLPHRRWFRTSSSSSWVWHLKLSSVCTHINTHTQTDTITQNSYNARLSVCDTGVILPMACSSRTLLLQSVLEKPVAMTLNTPHTPSTTGPEWTHFTRSHTKQSLNFNYHTLKKNTRIKRHLQQRCARCSGSSAVTVSHDSLKHKTFISESLTEDLSSVVHPRCVRNIYTMS